MLVLASVTESIVTFTWHLVRDGGLPAIFLLMAISSACIPIPSEVVLLFAGFAVAQPEQSGAHHHLTLLGVVVAALLGTLVGSWVAYAVGRAGRLELLERHGRLLHMGPAQIERADRWFQRYGDPAVLFGRLVPLLRAFVSLPAGVARMPVVRFTILTLIGSIPWVLALVLAGEALGSDWKSVRKGFEYVDYVVLGLLVIALLWLIMRLFGIAPRRVATPSGSAEDRQAAPPSGTAKDRQASAPSGTAEDRRASAPSGTVDEGRAAGPSGAVDEGRAAAPTGTADEG
jgi:membrane protein DedA with SNARE-associated domain